MNTGPRALVNFTFGYLALSSPRYTRNIKLAMSDSGATSQANLAALASRNSNAVRRRAAQQQAARPNSTRAAGAGGSSSTMMKLYTDDSKGLSVDPVVVLVLAISFVFSVVVLHVGSKLARIFLK